MMTAKCLEITCNWHLDVVCLQSRLGHSKSNLQVLLGINTQEDTISFPPLDVTLTKFWAEWDFDLLMLRM